MRPRTCRRPKMVVGINDPLIRVDDVFDHQIKPCLRSRFHYIPYERSLLCQPRKYGSAQVITFYEDALAGADKSCANDGLLVLFGHRCLAFGHPWIIQHDALFAHVRNASSSSMNTSGTTSTHKPSPVQRSWSIQTLNSVPVPVPVATSTASRSGLVSCNGIVKQCRCLSGQSTHQGSEISRNLRLAARQRCLPTALQASFKINA